MTITSHPIASGGEQAEADRRREQEARLTELCRQIPETIGEATDPVADVRALFEDWRAEPVDADEIADYPAAITPLALREVKPG